MGKVSNLIFSCYFTVHMFSHSKRAYTIYPSGVLGNISKACFCFVLTHLCAVRPVTRDKLRPPSKHRSLFRSFLQQRKAIFLVLQISALNQVNAGGFCLLFQRLQSGFGLLLLFFFITSLSGRDGLVRLYCCLRLC